MGRLAQGRLGYCTFTPSGGNELLIPVYDWAIDADRNRVTGDPVGNTWSTNYADGMLTSRYTARVMPRRTTLEAFSASFLQAFVNRVAVDGLDDTIPFLLKASDGAALYSLPSAKPESFTLTISKGSPVGLSVVFVAPTGPTITPDRRGADGAVVPGTWAGYNKTVDNTKLMMFDAASFKKAAVLTDLGTGADLTDLYNVEITYSNNHIVDAPLDGTLFARGFDAGTMRCAATFTVKAHHGSTGDLPPFNAESAIRVRLNLGGSNYLNLDMPVVVPNTDLSGRANVGASYRDWRCLVLGRGGATVAPPLVLS